MLRFSWKAARAAAADERDVQNECDERSVHGFYGGGRMGASARGVKCILCEGST